MPLLRNLGLLLVSCLVGLVLCEGSLRLFYPKYARLAEARARFDTMRLWARVPNNRTTYLHPDTGSTHALYHNNLGLRQHRNFSAAELAAATNVGIFGDSFTENRRMDAPYSLTEPLDYLLNRSGGRFNVLNFGVDGYGSGQSLLHYEHFPYAEDLAHVFYVYCANDLENLAETGLFDLDEAGRLVRHEAIRSSWWVTRMGRLHLPYLILDATGRLSSYMEERARRDKRMRERLEAERRNDEGFRKRHEKRLAIFRGLMRRWKQLVEHNGGQFHVVLLPNQDPAASPRVPAILREEDIATINLYDCFGSYYEEHYQRKTWNYSSYRFKNDGHWNEAGNWLAARCLYRVLEADMQLPALSEETLRATLRGYYAAFGGWMPVNAGEEDGKGARRPSLAPPTADIREKYQALIPPSMNQSAAFNVSLRDGFLVYHKEGCRQGDLTARFFVRVFPVDETDLPEGRRRAGFENRNFSRSGLVIDGQRCAVKRSLPSYPIRRIHTGQFVRVVENGVERYVRLWSVDINPLAARRAKSGVVRHAPGPD